MSEDKEQELGNKKAYRISEDEIADSYRRRRRFILLLALLSLLLSTALYSVSQYSTVQDLYYNLLYVDGRYSVLRGFSIILGFLGFILTMFSSLQVVRSEASSDKEIAKTVERITTNTDTDVNSKLLKDDEGREFIVHWNRNSKGELDESSIGIYNFDKAAPKSWEAALHDSKRRLIEETDRLSGRSTVNLAAGVVFSALAVLALILITVISGSLDIGEWSNNKLVGYFGPRISLVLIIQILASFFLRMYVGNERDISKNKNEITNIELRVAGAHMMQKEGGTLGDIARLITSEDRNPNASTKNTKKASPSIDASADLIKQIKALVSEIKP